jgi:S-adenosylmethionine/arginine decarboxylase-like enzyme/uncharacterized protein with PQ loop repeat
MAFYEEGMTSMDRFFEALGIIGGVSLSVCTVPQIWHMYKTKDARALQKRFLILYLTGTIFTFVYLVIKDAWAAWITMILEIFLTFLTLVYKIYLDVGKEVKRRRSSIMVQGNDKAMSTLGFISPQSAALPVDQHAFNPLTHEADLCDAMPVSDARYRGFHVLLDYSGFVTPTEDPKAFSEWNMAAIHSALATNGIRCVHSHAEVFAAGGPTPPGFTSVCLLDESHVSSHCYSEDGLLAIDIFTCGGKPQQTFAAARDIHRAVMAKLPGCKFIGSSTYRFPYRIL